MVSVLAVLSAISAVILVPGCTAQPPGKPTAPKPRRATKQEAAGHQPKPSEIVAPRKYETPAWPVSVTVSPDGSKVAVITENGLHRWLAVLDTRTGKWTDFGDADATAARWHPTLPVLIAGNDSADWPAYYIAWMSRGKRKQLFRSDVNPHCWGGPGVLVNDAIVVVYPSSGRTGHSGNFGYPIPWATDKINGMLLRLACGPRDEVAAEILGFRLPSIKAPFQHLRTYKKVPGRVQWLPAGRFEAYVKGKYLGYPTNPGFLASGRLVYVRRDVYRGDVYTSDLDGKGQRRALTIPDLHPHTEYEEGDWFTVDRAGDDVYYLNGYAVKHIHLNEPLR